MNIDLEKYIKAICRIYGVKIRINPNRADGSYWAGCIHLGTQGSTSEVISLFCHELAHYKNDVEGKYPIYHREDSNKTVKRIGIRRYAKYALKAEIYTEKEGKSLAKIWFPKYKYRVQYTLSPYYEGFMYGYYFSGV